jgi:hypothetical protein
MAADLRRLVPRGTKTVGTLATSDGDNRSAPIWSGVEGPGKGAPGVRTDHRWHLAKSVVEHVEGHVAAVLRGEKAPKEATLVVSKPPCDDEPWGCDRILPHVLPRGTRLTVYIASENGVRDWRTYEGTGKWLTR